MSSPIIQEVKVKNILSKSNLPVCEYSVNPYVGCTHGCKYCYASFMKRFSGHTEAWGSFLDVKHWPEIKKPEKYTGKELFIGSVTDPYLPQEETYERTRALLLQLKGSGAKLSIATKSDLILRVKKQCNLIWLENLNLRGSYKTVILDYIQSKHPHLLPLYREIYRDKNRSFWELLDTDLKTYAAELGLDYVTNDDSMAREFEAPPVIVNYFYHEQIKKSAKKTGA